MTEGALIDAGIRDKDTKQWTGPLARRLGITSEQDFLSNPLAQEKAFEVYLEKSEGYLRDTGATAYVGQTIDGIEGDIALTKGTLLAAAHRRGAGNVIKYLKHLEAHIWISDESTFPRSMRDVFLQIETRLRTFQDIRHRTR